MDHSCPRVILLLIFTIALSACGSGPATQPVGATEGASPTPFVLPPEITPTLSVAENTAERTDLPLPPAEDTAVISVETIAGSTSGNTVEAATVTPTFKGLDTTPTKGTAGVAQCNDSRYIDDITIPDGTVLQPGKEFIKTWRLQNYGSCIWSEKFLLGYAYGDRLQGVDTKLPRAVNPGQMVDISIKMIAPEFNNWYGGWWRLKTDTGVYFGDFVYVSVQVTEGKPGTPTP